MNPQERKQIRTKIDAEIQQLEKNIPNLKAQTQPIAPDDAIGRLTRMEAINSKSIQEANLRNAKQRLERLRVAQKKVEEESFGLCRECEDPIPLGRLLAMPEKDLCVLCAARKD